MLRRLWLALTLCAASVQGQESEISAIVNLADWSGRLAAHSLAAIFGYGLAERECAAEQLPLPTDLCGVTVLLTNDSEQDAQVLAPLFYVSPTQINFQVPKSEWLDAHEPFARQNAPNGAFVYVYPGSSAFAWSVMPMKEQAPAIFEYSTPSGQAPIILHADGTLVTNENPAHWDEFLTAYGTGFGKFTGDIRQGQWPVDYPTDGYPAPLDRVVEAYPARILQVTGEIEGVPTAAPYVAAHFVGLVPGSVGLNQVMFYLPCRLSQSPEPRIVMEGIVDGRTKDYRLPMSEAAKAEWAGSCH